MCPPRSAWPSPPQTTRQELLSELGKAQHVYTSTTPTSSSWTSAILGGAYGGLNGVACPSTTFCVATEKTGQVVDDAPPRPPPTGQASFTSPHGRPTDGQQGDRSVASCPSTTFCVAGESEHTGVLVMTGSTHAVRSSATYGTTNDLLSTSSLVVGGTTTTTATYGYDTLGQLTSSTMTGMPGATGSYTYDAGGDPTKVVDPANGTATAQTFNTNQAGHQGHTAFDIRGADATFTYDSIGARTSEKESGWSAAQHLRLLPDRRAEERQPAHLRHKRQLHLQRPGPADEGDRDDQHVDTRVPDLHLGHRDQDARAPGRRQPLLHLRSDRPGHRAGEHSHTEGRALPGPQLAGLDGGHHQLDTRGVDRELQRLRLGGRSHRERSHTTPIGYAGAYTDPVTGFLALLHRYYDPTTGQFLSSRSRPGDDARAVRVRGGRSGTTPTRPATPVPVG